MLQLIVNNAVILLSKELKYLEVVSTVLAFV